MQNIKRVITMLKKSFTMPITGVYSLCKSRILEKGRLKGRPARSMLSLTIIVRP